MKAMKFIALNEAAACKFQRLSLKCEHEIHFGDAEDLRTCQGVKFFVPAAVPKFFQISTRNFAGTLWRLEPE